MSILYIPEVINSAQFNKSFNEVIFFRAFLKNQTRQFCYRLTNLVRKKQLLILLNNGKLFLEL